MPAAPAIVPSVCCAVLLLAMSQVAAATNTGWMGSWWDKPDPIHYQAAWGLDPALWGDDWWGHHFHQNDHIRVHLISANATGTIYWPGEQPELVLQVQNLTDRPIRAEGGLDLYQWGMRIGMENMWKQEVVRLGEHGRTPFAIDLPPRGWQDVVVRPPLPETYGAYALIVDLPGQKRLLGGFLARTMAARPERVRFPAMSLDESDPATLQRLGIKAVRIQLDFVRRSHPDYAKRMEEYRRKLEACHRHNVTVLGMAQGGDGGPFGGRGSHLDAEGRKGGVWDVAWAPELDAEFADWIAEMTATFGWPKGPINAWHLWNEPWNGGSIAGWGADDERYREIYAAMCEGVARAERLAGVDVLVGGCDSSSNARDKLFSDGSDRFLDRFEFLSVHYQAMDANSVDKLWVGREPRTLIWDTESWIANSEGQVASVVAALRAAGNDRVLGMMANNIMYSKEVDVRTVDGDQRRQVVQAVSLAPALAAATQLIGERPFRELLFRGGLPWVMVFDGMPDADGAIQREDGTAVVVGDLGAVFGGEWGDWLPWRTARSLGERERETELRAQLAALPADAQSERQAIEKELRKRLPLLGATLTLRADPRYQLIDPYGNLVPAEGGVWTIPLNGEGWFLRGDGRPGSFDAMLDALRTARMEGIEPLAKSCIDLTQTIDAQPTLRLRLTNVLNRPLRGSFAASLGDLRISAPSELSFAAHETKEVEIQVLGGEPVPSNRYRLAFTFDAGEDGVSRHEEDMRCNVIARRSITVDGSLEDWEGALPQGVTDAAAAAPTMTEAAWWPMRRFDTDDKHGTATAWLAADEDAFHFAAKVADATPAEGMPRFATWSGDECYYPEVVWEVDEERSLAVVTVQTEESEDHAGLLVLPEGGCSRGLWRSMYDAKRIAFDLDLPEGQSTHVALYLQDPESRPAQIDVFDADRLDGERIATTQVESAQVEAGAYAVFAISGRVRIRLHNHRGESCPSVRGIFLSASAGTVPSGAQAAFIALDTATRGAWQGVHGASGAWIAGSLRNLPDGMSISYQDSVDKRELRWPDEVRRYSYWGTPILPSGTIPHADNIQIAFQTFPREHDLKDDLPCPPGTLPGFIGYHDSDYIFALNPVAERYGGGTEIFRLKVPGMPRKHFYPRHRPSPLEGAAEGRLVIRHEGNTRIVECSIPWSEIPEVKALRDRGEPVKFSFRVNDSAGTACMELARERSASRRNSATFRNDWEQHWANEIEFGWEP